MTKKQRRRVKYRAYLQSAKWRAKREEYFRSHPRACSRCGTTKGRIDLHHITYERVGNERLEDLEATCRDCHRVIHREMRDEKDHKKRGRKLRRSMFADRLEAAVRERIE